jgi:phospholipase C
VIVIVMQNRSFDHLFGVYPGVDGIKPDVPGYSQTDSSGNVVTPFLLKQLDSGDVNHGREEYLRVWNKGAMDQYARFNGRISMGHYDRTTPGIDKLWNWADRFALADKYFPSVMGSAPTNQLYMVAADSNGSATSKFPHYGPCTETPQDSPFTFKNVGDQMTEKNLDWKWFHERYGDCDDYTALQNPFQYFTSTQNSEHLQEIQSFFDKLSQGTLPPLSFVQAALWNSMHSSGGPVNLGADWLHKLLQQIETSSVWPTVAVIVTWDESGGWWDHVPPPQVDGQGYGARVPLLVISPFAKKGYISHVQMDHVSILKFIQWNFKLEPLNDRNQLSNNILDMFQF